MPKREDTENLLVLKKVLLNLMVLQTKKNNLTIEIFYLDYMFKINISNF